MNRQTLFSFIKTLLTAVGAFLIGKEIFGQTIDGIGWEAIVGAIMAVVSIVWSIKDKTTTLESIQATVRQVIVVVGGFFIASGKLDSHKLEMILGFIAALLPFIASVLSKQKSQKLASGEITVAELKKPTE